MNTPHDPHREALSDDERELAQRLARLGGPREPSAALDAAILAAARAAVAPAVATDDPAGATPAPVTATHAASTVAPAQARTHAATAASTGNVTALPPRTRKPRWPVGLSLAASLALAAGIGFKMLDEGTSHDTAESAAADSAVAFESEASEPLAEAVLIDPPLQRTPPPPPPPLADAGVDAGAMAVPQRARMPASAASGASAEAAADMDIAEAAAPAESLAAPAPAAPARELSQDAASEEDALDRIEVTGSRISGGDPRGVGAAEHTRTPLSKRREQAATHAAQTSEAESARQQDSAERRRPTTALPPPPPAPPAAAPPAGNSGPSFSAKPREDTAAGAASDAYDDRPPVSADSPEFRQAWLQRIRKLLAEGRRTEARASVLEFRRRYPDTTIPDDLRPLLAPEQPAPPTP